MKRWRWSDLFETGTLVIGTALVVFGVGVIVVFGVWELLS